MKIALYLAVSLLAIAQLFSIAQATITPEEQFSEFYYEKLRNSLWSFEVYVRVEQYLNELKSWISMNPLDIPEAGLSADLVDELEETITNATTKLTVLLQNAENDQACVLTISLQANLENIFDILSMIRDKSLATQWIDIYKRFENNIKLVRRENMRHFVHSLDDKVKALLANKNANNGTSLKKLKQWHDKFSHRYYMDDAIRQALDIRSFLPKSPSLPVSCDYSKLYH
ncbi:uncharacterized protein LOC142224099 [Haematobia irritans]|uniref:uncharacterized protein LOC142224099 n=1 Tax=Haematobia irritans TaxID=7368 RepID=UPI003F4F617E